MLKPLSGVLKYIWNPDEESNFADNVERSDAASIPERKVIIGKVTSIHSGYGMIDNEVYFSLECTEGQRTPQLDDTVEVEASRQQDSAGWRAMHVRVISHDDDHVWEDVAEEPRISNKKRNDGKAEEFVVGMVTRTGKDQGVVNESYNFLFTDCCDGYTPYKGDWVNIKLGSDRTTVVSVKPLREQSFEGKVNTVQSGFGYINSDIYFTFSVCEEGFVPRRGERVCGKAIEITRGRSTWRALTVVPIQGHLVDKFISPDILRSPMQLKSLKDLYADKKGISVTDPIDFGKLQLGSTKTFSIWIRNSGTSTQTLENIQVKCATECQFHLTSDVSNHSLDTCLQLQPGASTKVLLHCTPKYLGSENQLLVVKFSDFQIGRQVAVSVTDPHQYTLSSVRPYERRGGYGRYKAAQEVQGGEGWIVPGQRPQSCQPNIQLPNRLPQYGVPSDLRKSFLDRDDLVGLVPALGEELSMENYRRRFQTLLHLEEIQEEIDIRDFDLERVGLRPCGEYLALLVPGLAEGRPSVLIGDRVILSEPMTPENSPEYEGYVHEVMRDEVWLKFEQNFHSSYRGEDYNVRFTFNRTTLRRCHQASEFAPTLGSQVLFPDHLIPKPPQNRTPVQAQNKDTSMSPVTKQSPANIGRKKCPLGRKQKTNTEAVSLFNKKLNVRQRAAVTRILRGQSRPTPYVLFGPPGTGKTVTIVESILQIFTVISGSRIIACAPSNSAADLLCERLHESGIIGEGDMVRLNAFQRTLESIPECIIPYVCTGTSLELVSRYRVLVCTCVSAGMMFSLGLKSGHFTHAFVDEAGQATEPECMIPIGLVAGTDGQVVLAGDPMQLGPVLQSREAKDYGLGMSFLERLIQRELYARNEQKFYDHGSYDPLLVTKLVENYRSHPALVSLPSTLFYHSELVVSADKQVTECMCDWDALPNRNGCPLIFHGMRGEDLREGNSPSWFNPVEAVQVMKYLQAIVSNTLHSLSFDDIGIITPYRKQVEKIRLLIDKLGMEKVKVGSVEEFQGQERLVMIISTVRSNESHVGIDLRHNLGFLSNEKRFNVAITRAQALLIIIGNPHVLYQDPMWKSLIKYAVKQNAYIGCDLPELGDDKTDIETEDVTEQGQATAASEPSDLDVPASPPNELEKKIIRQMEYYFGDMNLIRDIFLKDQIQQGKDGWVDLSVILTFNRMKTLTTEPEVVCAALGKSCSGLLEVNKDHTHVRRSQLFPLVTDFHLWKKQLQKRTVVLEGLKIMGTVAMDNLQNFLEMRFGEVEHIERGIPKVRKGRSHQPSSAQLIVFRQSSSVEKLPGRLLIFECECWLLPPHHLAVDECIDYFYKRHVQKLDRHLVKPVGKYWYSNNDRQRGRDNMDKLKPQKPSASTFGSIVVNNNSGKNTAASGVINGPIEPTTVSDLTGDRFIKEDEQSSCSGDSIVSGVINSAPTSSTVLSEKAGNYVESKSYGHIQQHTAGMSLSKQSIESKVDRTLQYATDNIEEEGMLLTDVSSQGRNTQRIDKYMKYMEKDGIKYVRRKTTGEGSKKELVATSSSTPPKQYGPIQATTSEPWNWTGGNMNMDQQFDMVKDGNTKSRDETPDNVKCVKNGEVPIHQKTCAHVDSQASGKASKVAKTSPGTRLGANLPGIGRGVTSRAEDVHITDSKLSAPGRHAFSNEAGGMIKIGESIDSWESQSKHGLVQGIDKVTLSRALVQANSHTSDSRSDLQKYTESVESIQVVNKGQPTVSQGVATLETGTSAGCQNGVRTTKMDIDEKSVSLSTGLSTSQHTEEITAHIEQHSVNQETMLRVEAVSSSSQSNNQRTTDSDQNSPNGGKTDSLRDTVNQFDETNWQNDAPPGEISTSSPPRQNVNIIDITSEEAFNHFQSFPNYYCAELAQSDSDVIIEEEEEEEEEPPDDVISSVIDHGHWTKMIDNRGEDKDLLVDKSDLRRAKNPPDIAENWT